MQTHASSFIMSIKPTTIYPTINTAFFYTEKRCKHFKKHKQHITQLQSQKNIILYNTIPVSITSD
ncbi:hypothetical protein LX64_04532 [Chitinophaga skermanii]|uniref:Uncharacterized protein n=1 Tax=Chitinophaga skermanii TaxID=331697 RepID=A0A327Q4Q1_9BACT|nr:hypothetical protein LX64_04532 [Chitinophaga skermanii]